ncbi:MAG: hypothetical protein M1817_001750 [Caeruleum heppii]|nr:MAG: hypothetical protein M1817_001750 [Caeruleum heppii]
MSAVSRGSLKSIPTCYATCSIGTRPNHDLPAKLQAISSAGFNAIELSMPDLLPFASTFLTKDVGPKDFDSLCEASKEVKRLCEELGLKVLVLQPFANFEGWPAGSKKREDAFDRARGWIRIMKAAGTDMLQVGSSDSPGISSSVDVLSSDLRELADLLAEHNFRLAYENWCWATNAPTWKAMWEVVKAVHRPNVGLCLDTFQTAGSEWADPTTPSGLIEGDINRDTKFKASLEEFSRTIPPEKIYFLQISDAYKPSTPLAPHPEPNDDSGLRPRGRWSAAYRPLPFKEGYLPVVEVTRAVLRTGFRGWLSTEIFDGGRDGKGLDYEDMDVVAKEAMEAHGRLMDECADH